MWCHSWCLRLVIEFRRQKRRSNFHEGPLQGCTGSTRISEKSPTDDISITVKIRCEKVTFVSCQESFCMIDVKHWISILEPQQASTPGQYICGLTDDQPEFPLQLFDTELYVSLEPASPTLHI